MLKLKIIPISLFALFFIFACNQNTTESDKILEDNELGLEINSNKYLQKDSQRTQGKGESDPFTIEKVERNQDTLIITVSYVGGNNKHSFNLLWDGIVLLSYPQVVNLILSHDSNNDEGTESITEKLKISLGDLFEEGVDFSSFTFNVFSMLNPGTEPDVPFVSN